MIQQWKNTVPVLYSIMYSFKGQQNNKKTCFSIKALHKQWKNMLLLYILQWKLHVRTCNKNILFAKKYFSLLRVFTNFSVLLFAFWTQTLQ